MKDLLKLFKQHTPVENFDSIRIGLGFARNDPFVVVR